MFSNLNSSKLFKLFIFSKTQISKTFGVILKFFISKNIKLFKTTLSFENIILNGKNEISFYAMLKYFLSFGFGAFSSKINFFIF